MHPLSRLAAIVFVLFCAGLPCFGGSPATSGTTSLVFDGNRIYAELAFERPDGTLRTAFAFVDMGSPSMIVSEALFKDLHLDQKTSFTFRIGDFPVMVDSSTVTKDSWLPFSISDNRQVEALLPAGVMRNYQVVLDYARRSLTFAIPGTLKAGGIPIPFRINKDAGLIAIDVSIDGHSYPITIDCGSAYTWIEKSAAQPWLAAHDDWERGVGAVGPSNMRMADDGIEATGTLLRIPEILSGTMRLRQVGALAIGPSKTNWDFIAWYSAKNPQPVIGWLGGNVPQNFRIVLDYPNRMSYWSKQSEPDAHDLESVGLTLVSNSGSYRVAAIAARHGAPGDVRSLVLDRSGRRFAVQAQVVPF